MFFTLGDALGEGVGVNFSLDFPSSVGGGDSVVLFGEKKRLRVDDLEPEPDFLSPLDFGIGGGSFSGVLTSADPGRSFLPRRRF